MGTQGRAAREPAAPAFRPDIEGLRAVAVLLVLLYHARFTAFAGGFVGVDVFFVISGYLITSLLLRELEATRTVSLPRFWARRIRRLLPAAGLVLVGTLIASRFLLDGLSQRDVAHDVVGAALFVANFRFWKVGTDYLAQGQGESPVLHFWSLAVEEQFYLVWPGLLLVMTRVVRGRRRWLAVLCGAMWVASFLACVRLTTTAQPLAFFMLPTRAWELLSGVGLALAARALPRIDARLRAVAGWTGLLGIVAVAMTFDGGTRFPGIAALGPVVATMLVIVAGSAACPAGPLAVLSTRPLQWLGARSYAIYLWHFPILILAERHYGPQPWLVRVALLCGAIALAAASYVLVEHPLRISRALAAVPARSMAMGAWIIVASLGGAAILLGNPPRLDAGGIAAAPTLVALAGNGTTPSPTTNPSTATTPIASATTTGSTAASTVPPPVADASYADPAPLAAMVAANLPLLRQSVSTQKVPANLNPSLGTARNDLPAAYRDGCVLDVGTSTPRECAYGDPGGRVTIVLFGDSHAAQWMPALNQIALTNHWRLIVQTKKACPTAEVPTDKDPRGTDCAAWRRRVIEQIGAIHPDLVVLSSYRYKQVGAAAGRDPDTVWSTGLDLTLAKVRPLARRVLVLGDSATPRLDVPSCLAGHVSSVPACMQTRAGAVRPGRLGVERTLAAKYNATFVPTADWMCTDTACPVIVGNVLMYRDNSHITATAALLLVPYVEAALRLALG